MARALGLLALMTVVSVIIIVQCRQLLKVSHVRASQSAATGFTKDGVLFAASPRYSLVLAEECAFFAAHALFATILRKDVIYVHDAKRLFVCSVPTRDRALLNREGFNLELGRSVSDGIRLATVDKGRRFLGLYAEGTNYAIVLWVESDEEDKAIEEWLIKSVLHFVAF